MDMVQIKGNIKTKFRVRLVCSKGPQCFQIDLDGKTDAPLDWVCKEIAEKHLKIQSLCHNCKTALLIKTTVGPMFWTKKDGKFVVEKVPNNACFRCGHPAFAAGKGHLHGGVVGNTVEGSFKCKVKGCKCPDVVFGE